MFVTLVPQFGLVGAAVAIAFGIIFLNFAVTITVWRKLHLRWWDRRYLAWLPQAGVNIALAFGVSYLTLPLGAIELLVLLMVMYGLAAGVNLAFGLHEEDRDLVRHVLARATS
jgi:O-antigen/teichoic acid export membrane protein